VYILGEDIPLALILICGTSPDYNDLVPVDLGHGRIFGERLIFVVDVGGVDPVEVLQTDPLDFAIQVFVVVVTVVGEDEEFVVDYSPLVMFAQFGHELVVV